MTRADFVALAPTSGWAGVVFSLSPQTTTVNVGRFDKTAAKTATGVALNDHSPPDNTPLLQVKTDVDLQVGGLGAATIEPLNSTEAFGLIEVTPINPPIAGFLVIEFNPQGDNTSNGDNTMMTLEAFLNGSGTSTAPDNGISTFAFGNGENRVAAKITGDTGDIITKLVIKIDPANSNLLKQVRFSYSLRPTAVPEPSTLAMGGLAVLAGLGAGWRHRRKKAA
jgi:hypothetical protein